jgi:hypothetical protein
MTLPNRIFFTGVPGSRWSGIAQVLESLEGFNTSDRTPSRDYSHHQFTGHKGAYFGQGMELESYLDLQYIDAAWSEPGGCRIVKSHDYAYKLQTISEVFPNDWIMLVYRPDLSSYAWWHEAGGFQIKYPCYDAYKDSTNMLTEITGQNKHILEYAYGRNATWHYFTEQWITDTFGQTIRLDKTFSDILVTVIKV